MWSPYDRSAGKNQTPEQLEKAAARKRKLFEKAENALKAARAVSLPAATAGAGKAPPQIVSEVIDDDAA